MCLTPGIFDVLITLSLRLVGLLRAPMPTTLLFLISVFPRFIRLVGTPVPRAAFLVLCISTGVTSLVEGVATQELKQKKLSYNEETGAYEQTSRILANLSSTAPTLLLMISFSFSKSVSVRLDA